MSLNEIYDDPVNGCVKSWQNYRFNNINIKDKFNINQTGAAVGDILEVDAFGDLVWVPYSNTPPAPISNAQYNFSVATIPSGSGITIPFTSLTTSDPTFSISSGSLSVNTPCSLLLFCNIVCTPTSVTYPIFQMSKFNPANPTVIKTIMNCSPYRTPNSTDIPAVSFTFMCPVQCIANDLIVLTAVLSPTSTQNCSISAVDSCVNVIRVA